MRMSRKQNGFTLVEIALALLVISLISVGLMYAFGQQFKNTKYKESAANLLYSKKALLNFVQLNGYLPCPDTNGDGTEDRSGLACAANSGTLPYKDLGLSAGRTRDSWGNDIRYYAVANVTNAAQICSTSPVRYSANYFCKVNAPVYDSRTPPTASATDSNNLDIYDSAGGTAIANQMSVILVASNSNGGAACNTLSADEQENCDGDQSFVQHDKTDNPFFDDLLITISGYEIKRPQLFTSANLNGSPVFLSKFKDQHTKLYNALSQYDGDQNGGANWISRLVSEDKRLFESEKLMIYDNACATEPDIFSNPANYTTLPAVASSITLNTSGIEPNLKVTGDVTPDGTITAADEDNTVYIAQNMFGKIQLGNGKNTIIIAGKSAGDIVSGDNDDTVRVCQGAVETNITTNSLNLSPINFEFFYNTHQKKVNGKKYYQYAWKVPNQLKWVYHNVAINADLNGSIKDIDAIVEVVNASPNFGGLCTYQFTWWGWQITNKNGSFCLSDIDYEGSSTGRDDAIQPTYDSYKTINANSDIWIDIRVSFYEHSNYNTIPTVPVSIPIFKATAVDLDGWIFPDGRQMAAEQYEYAWFYSPNSFQLETNSYLLVTQVGNDIHAEANNPEVSYGITTDFTETMITTTYQNVSSFKYRIGLDLKQDAPVIGRINSIWFGQPQYKSAQSITVAGTLDLGLGNDQLLIGGNIDRDTYLGDGNNYAYFFSNSYQKVIGSNGDDTVTALGDLGWPAPDPNSLGWDLKGGNNSARVKGSCYAPILVGDGNDLFIVAADTDRDCAVSTNGGSDLILIDGTLKTTLNAGTGDDFAVIHATTPSAGTLTMGAGNDTLVIETLLQANINAGSGDDKIILQAGAADTISLIDGGSGNDTLEVNMTQAEWNNSSLKNKISGIETVKLLDAQITIP